MHHLDAQEKKMTLTYSNTTTEDMQEYKVIIGGMQLEMIPQTLAKLEEEEFHSFLLKVNEENDTESTKRAGESDSFSKVVAVCARDETNGRVVIARLLPYLHQFGHPEYAMFLITDSASRSPSEEKCDEKNNNNDVAYFLSDQNKTDQIQSGLAGILDASGSMDQVADLIQYLIEQLDNIPIWSCFGTKVHIRSEPIISEKMGIHTGKKSCTMTVRCGKPEDRRYFRFASLHGVSHENMVEMVSYRTTDAHGFETSLFRFQTWSANLFNLAWAMQHRNAPYVLLVIGDGEFDDIAQLSDLLVKHRNAFNLCRKIIFVAAPHIAPVKVEELTNIFAKFIGTTEGCLFCMLRPTNKTKAAMFDLARSIKEEVSVASLMRHIPGYRVLADDGGPIYIPDTDRRGIITAITLCPKMGQVLAKAIIKVVSERSTADRVMYDALFSQLYGALIALRFSENSELRAVSEWVRTELSKVNIRILDAIKYAPEGTREYHEKHRDLLSHLIDESKKDPTAFNGAVTELEKLLEQQKENGSPIHYLRTVKRFNSDVIKGAIRQIGADDFRIDKSEELMEVFQNLFTSEEKADETEAVVSFSLDSPHSIKLALGLMFQVHGISDILVKTRPLLLACLHLCYNLRVATVSNRNGIDATIALLAREFLRTFCDYSTLGLKRDGDEYIIKEFHAWMNNPVIMRLLLRANKDFGIIPSIDLVDILKNFIRARAFLELLNGKGEKRGVMVTSSVLVVPPNANGFYFLTNEYLPTSPDDERVQQLAPRPLHRIPRKKKWRATMTYDKWMDSLGIPQEKRRVMKTFMGEQYCAASSYRSQIDEMCSHGSDSISGMLDILLGVGLRMEHDGRIICTTSAWTFVELQRNRQPDGSLETWVLYWLRVERALIKTLKLQHKMVLSKIRVEDVCREWKQQGWIAVWLEGFPNEAALSFPVFGEDGELLSVNENKLHPQSLIMPKSNVNQRFQSSSSGEVIKVKDDYAIHLSWRQILAIKGIPESLGLNPNVIEFLMDKQQFSGTKLKFDIAPELLLRYDSSYDLPIGDESWQIQLEENFYTKKFGVKVKGQFDIQFGDERFVTIKDELSRQLEDFMKVSLSLREVNEDAVATCWICTEDERVGAKDFWVDLTECCGQALCTKCFEKSTRIDEVPLRLFPQCPFCASALDKKVLNRFIDNDGEARGHKLERLQSCVVHHDQEIAPFYSLSKVDDLKKSHRFSLCHECICVIATPRDCAGRVDDLPNTCVRCIRTLPAELNVKRCPSCGQGIERIDGCNNVMCVCGTSICWVCGEAVVSHDPSHFVHGYFGDSCIRGTRQQLQRVQNEVLHLDEYPLQYNEEQIRLQREEPRGPAHEYLPQRRHRRRRQQRQRRRR